MKKVLLGAALAVLGLTAVSAQAADADRLTFTVTPALVSEYYFRGLSQTDGHPAFQLGGEAAFKITDFATGYVGLWGSNVDFANGNGVSNNATAEVDFLGGFRFAFDKLSLDLGIIDYNYWGSNSALNLDFTEFKATAAYDFGFVIPSVGVYYTNNFQADSGTGLYKTAGLTVPIPFTEFDPKIIANIGHQSIEKNLNFGVKDYTDYNIGLFATFWGFTAGIQYVDTNLSNRTCFPAARGSQNLCGPAAVASVSYALTF